MNTEEFQIKEERSVEGITADYVWYNASILTRQMGAWANDFQKIVSVMEARHKEHLKILQDLMDENRLLKREIANLKGKNETV
jgi:hypothetical protein